MMTLCGMGNVNQKHMQEYLWRIIRDMTNDKNFVAQGAHALYRKMSKKDMIHLQWLMAEYNAKTYDLISLLKEIDKTMEGTNAGTK